jgi:hypothetical protein
MSRVTSISDTPDRIGRGRAAVSVLDAGTGQTEFIDPGAVT